MRLNGDRDPITQITPKKINWQLLKPTYFKAPPHTLPHEEKSSPKREIQKKTKSLGHIIRTFWIDLVIASLKYE